ncbi:alpha-L-fucosidase [Membranihabitans maritimus]|uniref:alpha-L-fucosidase n=1 Tax=Membranihabitans maritimus TaxID=2904244 RepID=UPI001F00DEF9|nr:alpha-L-fucosidase [Membranihabitans maritimus]
MNISGFYRIKLVTILIFFTLSFTCMRSKAQSGGGEAYPNLQTNQIALEDFSEMKFGLFVHWGPVSLRGTEIGWSRGKQVPIEEYDNLYKEFDPALFNADTWVKTASDAGMKYLVFTSKHHDGFCMWPSVFTDYDIGSTPYQRDILKELADACNKYNIKFGLYYSIADWHHPHYTTRYGGDPRPVEESNMEIYVDYMKNQLKELIDRYDPFLIWFDGAWENAYTHEMGMNLYAYLRTLKDDLVINDRVDKGHQGVKVKEIENPEKYAGDYATPEQRIGAVDFNLPWETCMTICKQWAWKPNDSMKSVEQSLSTLIRTIGGGGNLLYNVGPMLDGRIEQRQKDLLIAVGTWVKKNERAIYATKGGPYLPNDDFVSTRKGESIFVFVLNRELKDLKLPLTREMRINRVSNLATGNPLEYKMYKDSVIVTVLHSPEYPQVIQIDIDSDTGKLGPISSRK